jgi:hypothetical protein
MQAILLFHELVHTIPRNSWTEVFTGTPDEINKRIKQLNSESDSIIILHQLFKLGEK